MKTFLNGRKTVTVGLKRKIFSLEICGFSSNFGKVNSLSSRKLKDSFDPKRCNLPKYFD